MVKLGKKMEEVAAKGETFVSFEYYPPRTADGVENLNARLGRMKEQGPLFMDVTWGAGGATSDLTLELCTKIEKEHGQDSNMHLTCTNMPKEKVDTALEGCKAVGIQNILALRGDPPLGEEKWEAVEGGFNCALDLIKYIKEKHGDYFHVTCAGYPEGHPNVIKKVVEGATLSEREQGRVVTTSEGTFVCSDEDFKKELAYLKEKVDAGAQTIITQMVFDSQVYQNFVDDCRAIGIACPIVPGIMCVQNFRGFERMTTMCKSRYPKSFLEKLEEHKDDDKKAKEVAIEFGAELCNDLLAAGAPGLHFYCLNLEKVVLGILEKLGRLKSTEG